MIAKIRAHAGRLFLLAIGISLTSTLGHATARMMAAQIAQEHPRFAFELAVLIAMLLIAVHIAAFYSKGLLKRTPVRGNGATPELPQLMSQTQELPVLAPPGIAQLKLPRGLRFDSSEAIMVTTDGHPDRRILYVNTAFARLTGFEVSEWIGRSGDLLLADGPLLMQSLLWLDSGDDGREVHWIARLHRSDGTPFCAEAHLHRVAARDGSTGHVVLVMTDVTSRVGGRRAEAPLGSAPSAPA